MCSKLSLEERIKLVHEIVQSSKDAPEILCSFTRKELLTIICSEMGKERKYTGYTKNQMIEHLLKLVSQKSKRSTPDSIVADSPVQVPIQNKRQRSLEASQVFDDLEHISLSTNKEEPADNFQLCNNVACRASLSLEDTFCKRCSCCICHLYDDNKDPSLWLTCESDNGDENDSCGMSCHLECALKSERAGILEHDNCTKLDGSFYCVNCGKTNGIMRTWKKQLLVAKEARRVDVLCLRIALSHKILLGTENYKELHQMVEIAQEMLSKEVGQLDQVCARMSRGIVNRLSCGADVQKICGSAVECFDSKFSHSAPNTIGKKRPATCKIRFEESSPTSVMIVLEYEHILNEVLGCKLWQRKGDMKDYPEQPSFFVLRPEKRFKIMDLQPSTEYFCKVSLINSSGILGVWEAKWVAPALCGSSDAILHKHVEEESKMFAQNQSRAESTNSSDIKLDSKDHPAKLRSSDGINKKKKSKMSYLLHSTNPSSVSPLTPSKSDEARRIPSSTCEKRSEESDYEFSVRVIKWLENEGHMDEDFRVKFLTWFSLKANKQERRVVSVFVNTFVDDPPSLAGQLIHTFADKICCDKKSSLKLGFCTNCGVNSAKVNFTLA
ncbi:hypothetical protein UlMin_036173 [Ulmus minor]